MPNVPPPPDGVPVCRYPGAERNGVLYVPVSAEIAVGLAETAALMLTDQRVVVHVWTTLPDGTARRVVLYADCLDQAAVIAQLEANRFAVRTETGGAPNAPEQLNPFLPPDRHHA